MKFAELQELVGQQVGSSEWELVDQKRIDQFADATGDHTKIHVDPVAAQDLPFGQTIGHGFLTLSLMASFYSTGFPPIDDRKYGLNYGLNRVRFLAPVLSGKRVRGHFKLLAMVEKEPGNHQMNIEVTVEIEGEEKPAMIAEWLTFAAV